MCQETSASVIPRIIAVLAGEDLPWTGNEIMSRIESGDGPCEIHFHDALQDLLHDGKLLTDEDPWAPTLTVTTRCRLAYRLSPETKALSRLLALPKTNSVAAKVPPPAAPPPPPPFSPIPVLPALPSPAIRLEVIGKLRAEKVRMEREWAERFGPDCFRNGPAEFLKALFLRARGHGLLPRLRDALEKAQGRRVEDFESHCDKLLIINDRDGTIPAVTIDSGIKLDLMHYVDLDLDRAERDIREDREGSPANARELLAFLKPLFDDAALRRAATAKPEVQPVPSGSTKLGLPLILPADPAPKPARPPADPLLGSVFGPYKLLSVIGRGGMGVVYEGIDETLDRRVAVKVLHPQFAGNRDSQERFLREARNAANAKLDHPNITQIYTAGRQGPHLWLAMQFVRGLTLTRILEQRKKLPPDEALKIARQVAEGLAVAHSAQMIHRDIKPDNLMIDESGRVKIMDFGLMRSVDVQKDGLTQDGFFVGTLEYASPEQCLNRELDARTDLYSLGVVLYELLSGARPYKAPKAIRYLTIIPDPRQPPIPLRDACPGVPVAVEALVHRILSKAREERPASAPELVAAIDAVLTAPPSAPAAPSSGARKAVLSLVAWTIVLAAVITAAVFFWPKPVLTPPDPPPGATRPDPPESPLEKEAAALLLRLDEEGSLKRLLTVHAATKAGSQAARDTLSAFEKSLPTDDAFELVGAAAWSGWDVDRRDAPGGSAAHDPARNVFVLSAPSAKEQVRLLRKLKGSQSGYRLRWTFGSAASDGSAFMVALSFTRWVELGPRAITLFRADGDKVSTVNRSDFPERISGGTLHVFPRGGLVLVYVNERLAFALTGKEDALGSGLQLGMSGGTLTLDSVRVVDRRRD